MKKRENWIAGIGVFAILLIILVFFDANISRFIVSWRNIYLDYFLIGMTFIINNFIIFFLLTLFMFYLKPKRRWILPFWASIGLAYLINFLIKIIIRRPRPFQEGIVSVLAVNLYFIKDVMDIWDFSFPSGHAVLAFCVLPILNKEFRKFKWIWLSFAVLVGFSRIYFGVHYLSDVIAGAVLGYATGLLIIKLEEKYKIGERVVEILRLG
ncbi:phosphatase PAP2 family protein [Candidatus Pacearchaeota archaeon]|nr:phosphatase PAP2 family protein [Candidatus Pacearchaeota archaeon]